MRSAFNRETFRSITHSLGRFLAIAAIVALGTGFYAGLRMTAPDMKLAADAYFDGTALMDVRVLSTLGLTDDDMAALRHVEGVEAVMPAFETDVMITVDGEQFATRVHSLPDAARTSKTADGVHVASDDPDYLNRPVLLEGAWPQKTGECALSANLVVNDAVRVGDTVSITEGTQDVDDTLATRTYTVVGLVSSPYYATSSSMGTTTLGTGTIQQYMYVPEGDFSVDLPFTEAFLTVRGAAGELSLSEAYQNRVSQVMERIEALAPERERARVDGLRGDVQKELDEKRADYEREKSDAQAKLADAAAQLDDAKAQLDDAAATIASSEEELARGQADYDSGVAELAKQRESAQAQLDDAAAQLAASQKELDANRATIEELERNLPGLQSQWQQGSDTLAQQTAAWQEGSDKLDAGIAQVQEGIAQLDAGIAQAQEQLAALPGQVSAAQEALAAVQAQIDAMSTLPPEQQDPDALAALQQQLATVQQQLAALQTAQQQLPATIAGLQQQRATAQTALEGLNAQRAQLDQVYQQQIVPAQKQLDDAQVQIKQAQDAVATFRAGGEQLAQGRAQYEQSKQQVNQQLAVAQKQLDDAAAQLASGRDQLAQGKVDYQQGLADYESGKAEYDRQKADADEQLAEAERKLDDAQQLIDDLENPEWLVMDRTANYGAASFDADADRVDSIAAVFPFIFFLVAALVALTTMTRMVEEERALIGTYKALGYRRTKIASKFLIYAAVASGAGSLVGIVVLSQVLPAVIMNAYAIIYFVPSMLLPLPVDVGLAVLAAGLGVGVTLFATWAAATATLRERPARLMQPRAPKAGRRILLERVGPVWRRLSFSWKVTFRNLFRYKKRLVMTVIGIAGCTALLLTGLGLSDAINDIIDKQFGQITKYNATIELADDASADDRARVEDVLADGRLASASTHVLRTIMLAPDPAGENQRVDVTVPQQPATFDEFFALRTRAQHMPVELADEGLVISEKLARTLGVEAGDSITLTEQDAIGNPTSTSYTVTVTGVVENYIYHYAFMGPTLYERLTGDTPAFDSILAVTSTDPQLRTEFGEELRAIPAVKTVAYNDETIDAYRDMLSSVNMIVVVLVVAAASLAFIVLYNLTNINITERIREIATLKVLGFTPREMNAYIFRETVLLAIIGCAVGLVLGVWMEGFVVVTAEVDQVMFGREIHVASFLIAFALTMLFTVLVMLAMRGKLHKVSMVESLKSNE